MTNKFNEFLKDCGTSLTGMFLSATFTDWTNKIEIIISIVVQSLIALTTCAVNIHRMWRDRDSDLKKNEQVKEVNPQWQDTQKH